MKFEEAIALMRQGKKITHHTLGENVYLQAARIGIFLDGTPFEEWPMSIVKMLGKYKHPDMGVGGGEIEDMLYPGTLIIKSELLEKPCKHGNFPQLNLFLVMSEEWVLYE